MTISKNPRKTSKSYVLLQTSAWVTSGPGLAPTDSLGLISKMFEWLRGFLGGLEFKKLYKWSNTKIRTEEISFNNFLFA